jgi:hypothetical protein
MPRFIIKLEDGDREWLLEWSTVVDAPVTYGMSRADFRTWYGIEYGEREVRPSLGGMSNLDFRLARVDATGSSSIDGATVDDIISGNRAGDGESELTKEEITELFCRRPQ